MIQSFKSFKTLVEGETRIEHILNNYENYYAHTHKNRVNEKLHEHVHLVMNYASKLVHVHGLDAVLDSMIYELIEKYKKVNQFEKVGNFIKSLFVNALIYHDYGKVNENFQIDKMQDEHFFKRNESNEIGSQHSILSAYVFLNVHLNKVVEDDSLTKYERNLLAVSTFLFANPILKHHSSFFEHQPNFEEDKIDALEPYLELFKTKLSNNVRKYLGLSDKIFRNSLKCIQRRMRIFFHSMPCLNLIFRC